MSKQNIVILTLNDIENYGNRLQNYALAQVLSRYGEVKTAYCAAANKSLPAHLSRVVYAFVRFLRRVQNGAKHRNLSILEKRHKNCLEFTRRYVPDCNVSVDSFKGITPAQPDSTCYVVGSDQVWNYALGHFNNRGLAIYLGAYIESDKLISYAASFGVSSIEDESVLKMFKQYLPRFKAISVREYTGSNLVNQIADLNAEVVLDPTLLLSHDKWLSITRNFVLDTKPYVLMYFLGQASESQEACIQDFAKRHNFRIRRILDMRDKETYVAGPQDFVELFYKSSYVFTDSYHACCFSILFHKQFTVFNRMGMSGKSSMNSRMETLFRLFDLDAVMMNEGIAPEIDYAKVDQLLARHRAESQAWLDKAMEA